MSTTYYYPEHWTRPKNVAKGKAATKYAKNAVPGDILIDAQGDKFVVDADGNCQPTNA